MMANRQRAEARRKAQAKAARGEGGSGGMWVMISLAVVVVLGVGIAIFATGGDDSSDTVTTDSTSVDGTSNELPDSQPVTITGDALPAFDSEAATDPAVGTKAPILSGLNFRGEQVVVDGATDGPYMVVFLAHWCPHCNAEVPRLLDWKATGGIPAELKIVGVGTAVSSTAANYPPGQWFSNKGWGWPVIVDESTGDGTAGKAAQAYGASGWPYFVIVGKDGLVKARASGEVSIADLQKIVDAALAG